MNKNTKTPGWAEVRKEVLDFATVMEWKLSENDHKGGWDECSLLWLVTKLTEEVGELGRKLVANHDSNGTEGVWDHYEAIELEHECADIANVAMMIADLAFSRAVEDEPEPQ